MTTQTEEATRPTSVEQQIGRLEGGYDQLAKRVGGLEQAVDRLRADLTAKIDAQGESLRAEIDAQSESLRAESHAQGESIRAEMRAQFEQVNSRLNTMMVVGATVAVGLFTAIVGGFIAIFLRL